MRCTLPPGRKLAAFSVLLLLAGCGPKTPPAPPPPAVTVSAPLQLAITDWDEFTGRITAVDSVEVRARVDGYIESAGFVEGAMVKAGDMLFVIDQRPYVAELTRARAEAAAAAARLTLARNDEERAAALVDRKLVSAQELDNRRQRRLEAEAEQAAARARERAAELDVEYCTVRAPIAGRIGRRLVTAGNLVSGGERESTLLTTIVSRDPVHVYFTGDEQVYLRYLRAAHDGTRPSPRDVRVPARLQLADETGWPHAGYIDFVDNQLDKPTGTILARALFANPDDTLVPGLFARLQVRGAGPYPALLVPDSAIGIDQARRIVYVLGEGNAAVARGVTPGRLVGALRVITAGLTATDRVVINGQARIRAGMVVTPTEGSIEAPPELAGIEKLD